MKKIIILAIAIAAVSILTACNRGKGGADTPEIIRKDYRYEKSNWEFDIHLENIGNSDKISNLVNKLIYNNRNFDEYVSNMEKSVLMENTDDYELDTRGSYLSENYTIIYADEKYIVISYFYEEYYGYAAHPNHRQNCFFIDISEERLLLVDDLIKPIPEKTVLDLIKKHYEEDVDIGIDDFFRDTIWPPDLIKISGENTALIWNTYTLLPHAFGPVEVTNYDISPYLTDKGKEIMKRLAAAAPQAEKPAAADDEMDWAAWAAGQDAGEAMQFWWDDEPTVTENGDQTWHLNGHSNNNNITATWSRGTLTIIGSGAIKSSYYDDGRYPWTDEKEKPLLEIFDVIINYGITEIGDNAFIHKQLEIVTIADSVTRIGSDAFYDNNLKSVTIPNNVTSIGVAAFFHNPLVSITIGANVELENDHTRSVPYVFPDNFDDAYNKNGKQAGTYTLNNGIWTIQ